MDYLWNNENKLYLPDVTYDQLRRLAERKTYLLEPHRSSKTFFLDDLTPFDVLNLIISGHMYEHTYFDRTRNNFLCNLTVLIKESIRLRKWPESYKNHQEVEDRESDLYYKDLKKLFNILCAQVEEYFCEKADKVTLHALNDNTPND